MELESILGIEQLRYLAEDETRIGRKTETKRVITSIGVKPKAKVQWPREAFWVYGVVEPLTGWQWTQELQLFHNNTAHPDTTQTIPPSDRHLKEDVPYCYGIPSEYSKLDSENFQAFLNHLSAQLGSTVAVMQLDRAPAHRAGSIEWPENIIPIFQPAHCPERWSD